MEKATRSIQQNNPLNEELKCRLLEVDGVQELESGLYTGSRLSELTEENGDPLDAGIGGISEKSIKELRRYVEKGSLDDEKLKDGRGIILSGGYVSKYPGVNWKIGDRVHLAIEDGNNTISKEFEIVAITNAPVSLTGSNHITGTAPDNLAGK